MTRALAWIALFALAACATAQTSVAVFNDPRPYLGQTVRVCGVYQVSNLIEEARGAGRRRGLSIVGPLLPRPTAYGEHVCVVGEISYIGCESGPEICLDWAYDYAIRIQRMRVVAPPLGRS